MFTKLKIKKAVGCIDNNDNQGLRKLLEKGLDPSSKTETGKALWMYALKSDNDDAFSIIKEYKAIYGIDQKIKEACTFITSDNVKGLEQLLQSGLDPNSCDAEGDTLLNRGIKHSDASIVQLLLSYKGCEYSSSGAHPLVKAAGDNNDIMDLLLSNGIFDDDALATTFAYAARNNDLSIANILLKYNFDVSKSGLRAFKDAIKYEAKEFLEYMIGFGYDLNTLYDDKSVLMMLAASRGDKNDFMEVLISMGADPLVVNSKGQNALDFSMQASNKKVTDLLRKHIPCDIKSLTKRFKDLHLPDETIDYLLNSSSQKEFSWPKKRNIQEAHLKNLEDIVCVDLRIDSWQYRENYSSAKTKTDPNIQGDGAYRLSALDLLSYINGYYSTGVLIWIPELKQFGTADADHGVLYVFKDVGWDEIIKDLHGFINHQWFPKRSRSIIDIYKYCKPWEIWEYR